MHKHLASMISIFLLFSSLNSYAKLTETQRFPEFSNDKVNVWKTLIYPNKNHTLKMHRHEYNRIVVALTSGILKITNHKGLTHHIKLEKDHAYYLSKDVAGELHTDENLSQHPIKVLVIELKTS